MSDTATLNEPQIPEDVDIHDPAFVRDPFTAYERLRQECPIARSNKHGGFWLMTRYDDVRAGAINWRDYTSSVAGVTAIPVITPRTEPMLPIEIDPPRHSRYRALVNPVFAPERVAEITPRIGNLAASILARMAEKGRADVVAEFCVPVAITSLAAFTDVPLADSNRWVRWITKMFDVSDPVAGAAASRELVAYIDGLIAARRGAPTGDFISMLMAAEIDGESLDDGQIRSFMTVVFGAGFETTADGLSVMLHWLAENPGSLARLAGEPSLIPTAVEEFLRFSSPIQIFGRNAACDLSMHERRMQAGDIVALGFGSANRDPAVFEAPDELRVDRRPNRHLSFGAGPHLCAGAGVARMEFAVTLEALIEAGIGLALDAAVAPRWKTRGDRRGFANLPLLIERKKTD
ncbi:cytochrome P450 [Mesorhizobium sp. PAMC28654]|uniref:cytochrome P450 n=1 Tax=Mesorhizobium sp. PAMC28654 TaxID=2880934 RepID=UPI001D0BCA8B|nr:cytochrome P450 [Mesorhizobium sp. PAMC28654]UDL88747.1 cytochrome P450 [Mesorhizobium sp. PAMC28654]